MPCPGAAIKSLVEVAMRSELFKCAFLFCFFITMGPSRHASFMGQQQIIEELPVTRLQTMTGQIITSGFQNRSTLIIQLPFYTLALICYFNAFN